MDTVTFTGVVPAVTSDYNAGTLQQRTAPSSYTIGRVDYAGSTTEINGTTGDWIADNAFRCVFPGGSPSTDRNPIGSQQTYAGTATFSGSFFINSGATVPLGGSFNFLFINTYDDPPAAQTDNTMDITFNFTDEVIGAPASTPVSATPGVNALTTAALNITSGGIAWYKVTVTASTDSSKYLDIDTNGSGVDLDFGWFNNSGTNLIYRDGQGSPWEPWLSFGAPGETRPPTGNILLEGQDGNISPGIYYVAVGFYPMAIGAAWTATTSSTATYVGTMAFRSGMIAPPTPPPTPIYEQLVHVAGVTGGEGISVLQGTLDGGVSNFDRQVADDVVVPASGWNITGASGSFLDGGGLTPTHVEVTFYQRQNNGQPGAVVATFDRPWSAVTVFNEGIFFGSAARRFLVDLGTTQLLTAGNYMIAVRPRAASGNNYFWLTSSPSTPISGNPAFYRRGPATVGQDAAWPAAWTATGQGGVFTSPLDLAFALYGTVATPSNIVTGTVNFGQLGGIPYNSGANLPSSLGISWRNAANAEVAVGTATYNPLTGAFSANIPNTVTGPFRLSFKHGFWLRRTLPDPASPAQALGSWNFGLVAPEVGDADDDNAITPSDYGIWQVANGTFPTENTSADFDGDGAVTPSDYGLWQVNNGAFGDD